jgi:DNA-binding NarL/FixJ family response regulator
MDEQNTYNPDPYDGGYDTRVICANFPETRVIMLSMHSDEEIMIKAKEFGAHCFLTKECRPIDVVAAIRAAYPANQLQITPPTNSAPKKPPIL